MVHNKGNFEKVIGPQQMKDTIQKVITKRQNGEGEESIPFIDALLQSGVPDKQVSDTVVASNKSGTF